MGDDQRKPGSDLSIVDNSDADWNVRNYLTEWCGFGKTIDIATGYFEIGALLTLRARALLVRRPSALVRRENGTRPGQWLHGPAGRIVRSSPVTDTEEPEPGSDSPDTLPVTIMAGIPVSGT